MISLSVTSPGGLHEQSYALLGNRLVEEAVDRSVGDLGGERALVVDPARHDQHEIRKLRLQALGQAFDRTADGGCVQDRNPGVLGKQLRREIGLGTDREYIVVGSQHL